MAQSEGGKTVRYGAIPCVLFGAGGGFVGLGALGSFVANAPARGVGLTVVALGLVLGATYCRRWSLTYFADRVAYRPGLGAPFTFTWDDLVEARYSPRVQGWHLRLRDGRSVAIHSRLEGVKGFLAAARARTKVPIPEATPPRWS